MISLKAEKKIEELYKKDWPAKRRPLDVAYVNFIVHEFRKGRILDIGCGFGELIEALKASGFDVKGIVASKYEFDECKRKGLSVLLHDASKKLPYADESFDFIISIGSIEHIKGWQNALNEMHRVLKKNGKVLIETPNHSVFRKTKKYFNLKDDFDLFHIKEFDFDELVQELDIRGFTDVKAHDKWFYYPNHFFLKAFDSLTPKAQLPYLFFSAVKK